MRRRNRRALAILQAEIAAGIQLGSWSWDWLDAQQPRTLGMYRRGDERHYPNSCQLWCYGCGREFDGIFGSYQAKLCYDCWKVASGQPVPSR